MTTVTHSTVPTIVRLAEHLELAKQLTAWAHGAGRHSSNLWLMAWGFRRESQWWLRDLQANIDAAGSYEIDPDDGLTDCLLDTQARIKTTIQELREQRGLFHFLPGLWLPRWMLRLAEREFVRVHAILGQARTLILEHDADCSLVSPPYATVEELIDALKRAA